MAYLKQAKSDEEVKKLTLSGLKKAYLDLSRDYTKILDGDYIYCGKCNSFLSRDTFYNSQEYASGKFPVCKKCLMLMATDYDKKTNTYTDNKEKTKETLRFLNLPFIESTYNSALSSIQAEVNEKNRSTAWQQYITMVQSLPNWKGKKWDDSEFDDTSNDGSMTPKARAKTIKFFGSGFSDNDYAFLQDQYDDWRVRYSIEDKSMEEIVKRICFKQLDLLKAQQQGRDTKELDKTFQDLLGSANLKPNQNRKDTLSDAQTFGQLIAKWEDEKPIPECEEDFRDIDKIGLYLDVFFKGHLAKMLNLKNPLSHIYEKFMKKYTVEKPEYDTEENSEALFDVIFGSVDKENKL